MSRFIVLNFLCVIMLAVITNSGLAQVSPASDSVYRPSQDSLKAYDSLYRARRAMLDQWISEQRKAAHPQEDFLSIYASYGAYLQILPKDLNQFFSERTLRPNPLSDRNNYGTVDRAIILGGQAQLSRAWGIYLEYDYTAKFFNTIVDDTSHGPQSISGIEEELDLNEHSLMVGGMVMIYSSQFYRLRANGGIGAVYALTTETEKGSSSRSASAKGYQINFDLLNDFRVMDRLSFTIDLLTRSITTGKLKTSSGQTLDTQFGRGTPPSIAPNASNFVYGFAAGLVYYF